MLPQMNRPDGVGVRWCDVILFFSARIVTEICPVSLSLYPGTFHRPDRPGRWLPATDVPAAAAAPPSIPIGTFTDGEEAGVAGQGAGSFGSRVRFQCDAPELTLHVGRPWFTAYVAERLELPLPTPGGAAAGKPPRREPGQERQEAAAGEEACVTHEQLARHALVCGATGSGKTRFALHLLQEQLRAGCSLVLLDPKAETLHHVAYLAAQVGIRPEQVTVLWPRGQGQGAPGWNPLDAEATGIPPAQAAGDLVSVLAQSTASWGPRLQDLLTNALLLISTHGLSLDELARFLQRDDYREALLAVPAPPGLDVADRIAFLEAHDYFLREFGAWSKNERTSAVAPVTNKVRELLRSPFLRALLCARGSTLDLPSLWQRPRVILVHLDRTSLGDEGARLLGGLLTHQLYRTAMRVDGPVPVVLSLDEMGVSEKFLGSAVCEILAVARSRKLRLLVACQHLAQLSDALRAALLANTAVQAFFRLGHADAKIVAGALAAGTGATITRVDVSVAPVNRQSGEPEQASRAHVVRDGFGSPLRLSPHAWEALVAYGAACRGISAPPGALGSGDVLLPGRWANSGGVGPNDSADPRLVALARLAGASQVERLYVHAPDTGEPVALSRYVACLPADLWRLRGPAPLELVVRFPRPRLSVVSREGESERQQRWIRQLLDLPVQRAIVRTTPAPPGVVQVVAVPGPDEAGGAGERFVAAALGRGGGQSAAAVERTYAWRRARMEALVADSRHPPAPAGWSGPPQTRSSAAQDDHSMSHSGGTRDRLGSESISHGGRQNAESGVIEKDAVGSDGSLW